MKQSILRRLGAFVLTLGMVLSVAVTPAMAADAGTTPPAGTFGVSLTADKTDLKAGETANLTATVSNVPNGDDGNPKAVAYEWSGSPNVSGSDDKATITFPADAQTGSVTITVTAKCEGEADATASVTLNVTAAPEPKPLTGISIPSTLSMIEGKTETLTPTFTPADADDKAVTWSVTEGKDYVDVSSSGVVTAKKAGTAKIVVQATNNSAIKAECTVTVTAPTVPVTSVNFSAKELELTGTTQTAEGYSRELWVNIAPADATYSYDDVKWSVDNSSVLTVEKDSTEASGRKAFIKVVSPGVANVTATVGDKSATCKITVSGITLNRTTLTMSMGGKTETLTVTAYGDASKSGTTTWMSDNNAIVAVANASSGRLTARALGKATITATKGSYTAKCEVTVLEDTSALVGPVEGTAGSPLNLGTLTADLQSICWDKTNASLSYISNLSVSTTQGILYYDYLSEADHGAGVGQTERYYVNAVTGQRSIGRLSFVPRATFNGDADISYSGYATNGQNFSGVIRVHVGAQGDASYTSPNGAAVNFLSSDLNAVCRNQTGRNLNYVTFTLPQASWGTLYYNYNGTTQYSERVTATTRYYRTSLPYLDGVSFVPAATCPSVVRITYMGVDTAGASYTGWITINVSNPSGSPNASDVYYTADQGSLAIFRAADFNVASLSAINESLSYVRFTGLPAANQGTLYYNYRSANSYDSRVNTGTSYYRSGTPSLGSITFVPSSTGTGRVAIPYVGYGTYGTTFSGTVYIDLDTTSQQTIRYTTYSGKQVNFLVNDFNNACVSATGNTLNYVRFAELPQYDQGNLYYNYRTNSYNTAVSTYSYYYRSGTSYQQQLSGVSYLPTASYTGTVRIPYVGYSINNISFEGTIVIQVSAPAPADINLNGNVSTPVRVSSTTVRNACTAVMNQELSYIQITSLPEASAGRLYSGYSGYDTGTQVSTGTRFYRTGTPSIDQLSFVPKSGQAGTATVTYLAVSTSGEQMSGQINFIITKSTNSRYFNDMGRYTWASDAVDYLYLNKVTEGMGGGKFGPEKNIRRCDFVVMLCRAFNLTGGSGYSFADVPTNSYYANAVATAKNLGIISGYNGYFQPNSNLTREDAMVMIRNTLVAAGWSLGSGLTADLSNFSDNAQISGYARNAVGTLVQLGAVQGDGNGLLRPKGTINRAEAATLIHFIMTM